jgi:pimeloyl-ACP methyl ester carboxylesterase
LATFVLVHGAWHVGSAWQATIQNLESKGHRAFAPTICGNGKSADKRVNHAQCTKSIVDAIVAQDLRDFVLVGHSFGGTIIAKVTEAIPERIRRLVFLTAFVLRDGKSLLDEVPPETAAIFHQMAQSSADNTVMLPFPVFREQFINDVSLEVAQKVYAELSPQPFQPLVDRLDLKKFYSLPTPKSYINCTEDIALPPGEFGWHPRMSGRLGLSRLVQMPGGHEVMYSNPAGLAEKIVEAGRD